MYVIRWKCDQNIVFSENTVEIVIRVYWFVSVMWMRRSDSTDIIYNGIT